MSQRPDDPFATRDDDRDGLTRDERSYVSHRGQLMRGVVAAAACAAACNVPWAFLRGLIRPDNVASALGSLLLSVNMLAGYVGGRAAARAGLAHDDGRAQWSMAWTVAVLSLLVGLGAQQVRFAVHPPRIDPAAVAQRVPSASALLFFAFFTVTVLLIRFGFAMGTYAQAKREGRPVDEDEANAD
jgi:hypothetical protein